MGRVIHKDFGVKLDAASILMQIVTDVKTHRYINKADVRNLLALVQKDPKSSEPNDAIAIGLKILIYLTETDEFMDLLFAENAYLAFINLIGDGFREVNDIDALHALHNLLCSIYGKKIIMAICQMPNNAGLEALMSLIPPPTIDNVKLLLLVISSTYIFHRNSQ